MHRGYVRTPLADRGIASLQALVSPPGCVGAYIEHARSCQATLKALAMSACFYRAAAAPVAYIENSSLLGQLRSDTRTGVCAALSTNIMTCAKQGGKVH
jgi:hypothetical protein